ncbi:MAG: Fur family transcriptional regulator [Syntrophomonadaceae bacterium]|jgi:Fur family ferric uptake transcriptional regulator
MCGGDYREKLAASKYRLTGQRATVLEVMVRNRGKHLSADEVLQQARLLRPNIGIATVYRTLDKLASMEVLYKGMFDSGKYRYELVDDNQEHHHHHVVCVSCGNISEIKDDLLCELERNIRKQGFQIIDHDLKFFGYCPRCSKP